MKNSKYMKDEVINLIYSTIEETRELDINRTEYCYKMLMLRGIPITLPIIESVYSSIHLN